MVFQQKAKWEKLRSGDMSCRVTLKILDIDLFPVEDLLEDLCLANPFELDSSLFGAQDALMLQASATLLSEKVFFVLAATSSA